MVCSAAVGLATVMVITLTAPGHLAIPPGGSNAPAMGPVADVLPESLVMPWDGQL
jgi:hypothetical protein